jgi:TRAP transporter TAXI family solute receptor
MRGLRSAVVAIFVLAVGSTAAFSQAAPSRYQDKKRETNDIAVSIVVAGLTCTCARFAEDIRNVINDLRPDGLRVLPMLGVGGLQNIRDLLFLRGVDMGVVDQDTMTIIKKTDPVLYANLEQRIHYITKLYNAEFHVLAREEIKTFDDLRGKRVSFNLKDSQTHITADNVFNILQLDVQRSHYDNDEAIRMLKANELDAMIVLTGGPNSGLARLKRGEGLHFIPLDERSWTGPGLDKLYEEYLPAELTHELYPGLVEKGQPVSTIANRALLAVYNWPENSDRYRKLEKFVSEFFSKIESFNSPARHQKWKEINLAAEVPGWTRFKPAREWLEGRRNLAAVSAPSAGDEDVKVLFERFIETFSRAEGQRTISPGEREVLFAQFRQFMAAQGSRGAAR